MAIQTFADGQFLPAAKLTSLQAQITDVVGSVHNTDDAVYATSFSAEAQNVITSQAMLAANLYGVLEGTWALVKKFNDSLFYIAGQVKLSSTQDAGVVLATLPTAHRPVSDRYLVSPGGSVIHLAANGQLKVGHSLGGVGSRLALGGIYNRVVVSAFFAPPSDPQDVTVSSTSTTITVTWEAPQSDGGSPITAYRVYTGLFPSEYFSGMTSFIEYGPGIRTATVTGLVPDTGYFLMPKAVNQAGEGSPTDGTLKFVKTQV